MLLSDFAIVEEKMSLRQRGGTLEAGVVCDL